MHSHFSLYGEKVGRIPEILQFRDWYQMTFNETLRDLE